MRHFWRDTTLGSIALTSFDSTTNAQAASPSDAAGRSNFALNRELLSLWVIPIHPASSPDVCHEVCTKGPAIDASAR